jgi:hypothetical protein
LHDATLTVCSRVGWSSLLIFGLFAAAALGLAVFVLIEQRAKVPMLELGVRPRTAGER